MKVNILKRLLKEIGRYAYLVILSLGLALVSVALTLYVPILIGKGIDTIAAAGEVNFMQLLPILQKIGILICVTAIAQWLMNICNNHVAFQVVSSIREKAFTHLEELPLSYLDRQSNGDTISRIITDVDQFSDGLLMGFSQLFTGAATIIGTLIFMFSINFKISFVVVVITPASLVVASYIARKSFTHFRRQSETRGEITSLIDEMVGNQKLVQAFGYEKKAAERFEEINQRLQIHSLKAIFYSSTSNPATRFVNGLVYTAVGITGAFAVIKGVLSVGQLTSFLTYANQYTKPFNEISSVITELQNALASAQRVFELLDETPVTPEPENALVLKKADGRVTISRVSFSYRPEVKLIQNLNLRIEAGQRVAIVGPTGCGKSTLINLLMRFYEVEQGEICVSGTPVPEITRKSLRANFGMVLQETWLKSASIRENIAYGRPGALEEEIIQAAKAVHAHGFIKRMKDGYDTVISEDGGNLSAGQKQLLCIARVMLCLPPMLILDEATSSIDTRTEIRIQKAFLQMMEGRTSFIVAHRLSTIREADIILVMNHGDIVEQGTHEELLARNGFYAQLYNSQFALV